MVEFEDEDEDGFVDDELIDGPMEEDLDDDASIEDELDSEDLIVDDLVDDVVTEPVTEDVDDLEIATDGEIVDPAKDFGDDFDEAGVALPPTATFDGDGDGVGPVVVEIEDEDDSDDAVREGEFICRSCFMAKRESAIADEERMLCLDCV